MERKSLREKTAEMTAQLEIMEGRKKAESTSIMNKIVTIVDYGFLKGDDGEYVVFIIKEDSEHFYFGGKVLTDNMKTYESDGYHEDIQKEGLPIRLTEKKSKNNRKYTGVEFYPENDLPF